MTPLLAALLLPSLAYAVQYTPSTYTYVVPFAPEYLADDAVQLEGYFPGEALSDVTIPNFYRLSDLPWLRKRRIPKPKLPSLSTANSVLGAANSALSLANNLRPKLYQPVYSIASDEALTGYGAHEFVRALPSWTSPSLSAADSVLAAQHYDSALPLARTINSKFFSEGVKPVYTVANDELALPVIVRMIPRAL